MARYTIRRSDLEKGMFGPGLKTKGTTSGRPSGGMVQSGRPGRSFAGEAAPSTMGSKLLESIRQPGKFFVGKDRMDSPELDAPEAENIIERDLASLRPPPKPRESKAYVPKASPFSGKGGIVSKVVKAAIGGTAGVAGAAIGGSGKGRAQEAPPPRPPKTQGTGPDILSSAKNMVDRAMSFVGNASNTSWASGMRGDKAVDVPEQAFSGLVLKQGVATTRRYPLNPATVLLAQHANRMFAGEDGSPGIRFTDFTSGYRLKPGPNYNPNSYHNPGKGGLAFDFTDTARNQQTTTAYANRIQKFFDDNGIEGKAFAHTGSRWHGHVQLTPKGAMQYMEYMQNQR